MSVAMLIVAGGLGALLKDVLRDNAIELPHKINSKLILGSIGGVLVGAFVGYVIDESFLTAFMGGFFGFSVIEKLIPYRLEEKVRKKISK